MAELINRDILLEVCPTSNIKLGVYPTLEQHPLPQLVAAGVPCTVNSDDPPLFNTTMLHEAELLDSAFHFDKATIDNLLLNGVKYSFLPSARKEKMLREFQ
ncbi:MAG TPA: adenosine deaminase, partial [Ktedonobacter sp.]|nr:adenosine deaminase [Ktedonobacter sp.]